MNLDFDKNYFGIAARNHCFLNLCPPQKATTGLMAKKAQATRMIVAPLPVASQSWAENHRPR